MSDFDPNSKGFLVPGRFHEQPVPKRVYLADRTPLIKATGHQCNHEHRVRFPGFVAGKRRVCRRKGHPAVRPNVETPQHPHCIYNK